MQVNQHSDSYIAFEAFILQDHWRIEWSAAIVYWFCYISSEFHIDCLGSNEKWNNFKAFDIIWLHNHLVCYRNILFDGIQSMKLNWLKQDEKQN